MSEPTATATKPAEAWANPNPSTAAPDPAGNNTPPTAQPAPEGQAPATTGGALQVMDYGADAGKGLEGVSFDELSVPFLSIAHYVCPQIDPSDAKFIPGCKPGMLFNTATKELYEGLPTADGKQTGIDFIPCHRDKNYVEYTPRDKGGGFVATYGVADPRVLEMLKVQGRFKKLVKADGNELTETKYLYGLFVVTSDYVFPGVLGFSSKRIKAYTNFMDTVTKIEYPAPNGKMVNPPMWAHRWHLTTAPDSNKKGKFFVPRLNLVNGAKLPKPIEARLDRTKPEDEVLYQKASALYESIKSGRATAAYDATDAKSGATDDDIPF